ncbi:hybrid sensor histidine kinase/response regulator [Dyella sp.]|jgi:signal transduction histidine kinase/streptogramin lyase/ActR/RegA family two-component response regulator|uniref:hybrid sensor histidine kinase/response regulator n=1 Tax=Dyella sp. TaxID=1869338 RepID=UPI002D77B7BD|nr:two-component regulator propeller domain-containing protein [Dyella sp.]HET6431706.1 two-component regulator propeller domain-containing protein [Dyella sp.]
MRAWLVVLLGMAWFAAPSPVRAFDPPVASGALPTPQFRRYGSADGLPSSSVYAVVQDPTGAMWFGTKGGLARYDGVQFETFHHVADDPGSLPHNTVGSLLVDHQGRLWTGGLEAGLNRYLPATGTFAHWAHDPANPASLATDKVWTMAQTADGTLWVGTEEGLDRMRADGTHFDHLAPPADAGTPARFGAVASLFVDRHDRLWIGSAHGVFRREPDGRIIAIHAEQPTLIDAWSIDGNAGDDEIRIAATRGLYLVGKDDVARPFEVPGLPATNIMSSVRDRDGRLWIGTQRGLYLQQAPHQPLIAVMDKPVLYGNLPGTWIWKMIVGREGGLWITLFDGGVAYLAPGWHGMSRYTHIPDEPESLRDSMATAVAHARDETVWVGERGGRVDKLEPSTGRVQHVLSGLYGDVVGMTEDAQHNLWIATKGALYRYAAGKLDEVDPAHAHFSRPLEVEVGPDGRLYARTFGEGLFRIDQRTLAVSPVPIVGATEKARWGSQMTLRFGVFWYAGDGGLLRLDARHEHFEPVPGVRNDRPVDAFDTSPQGFWLARSDGLEHYRLVGDALVIDRSVRADEGWPSINVVDLRIDAHERLWIFGSDGLWRFDPGTGRFRALGLQDGLANGEFFRGYSHLADGTIYAPTFGGVIGFNPDRIVEQQSTPPLHITGVRARRHGKLRELPADGVLRIDWRDREMSVVARLFSYIDPTANRYRFRMVGLDQGWVEVGNRGEREFAGLVPGDYTLEVMGAGASDRWVTLGEPLRIHVAAPPWARWWAWLAYALSAVLVVAWALWLWQRRLAQRHRLALSEQQRQLAEQSSAAKTTFLATLSHEIRTPMTGVIGMAELLLSTPLRAEQNDYARAMQRSGAMLLKLLNDALDLARIEAGRFELELAPFDPRELLRDVADLTAAQAQGKGITFELQVSPTLPPRLLGDAMRIKQILLNLTGNAVKFTEYGGVVLAAESTSHGVTFSVRDTGPGIPEASQSRLFQRFEQERGPRRGAGSGLGLAICRELVTLMHGSIELESRLAHGSTFRVRLPLQETTEVPPPEPAAPPAPPAAAVADHLRVLLVEDDAIVAAVIRGLLDGQGHTVVSAVHGLGALAELSTCAFDVMLLDLDLPGVDGFQVARLVRQRESGHRRLPIVAITARSGGDEEVRSLASGMDAFLRKPFSGAQLAQTLAQVTAWRSAQDAPEHQAGAPAES